VLKEEARAEQGIPGQRGCGVEAEPEEMEAAHEQEDDE